MDINGDQVPDFVGTNGVATFTFFVGNAQHLFGSITTAETSFIQGVTATGQLQVGSQGTITGSTALLDGLSGGMASSSIVALAPSFQMQTSAHFTVNRPIAPVFSLLAIAAELYNTPVSSTQNCVSTQTVVPSSGHGESQDHSLGSTQQDSKSSAAANHQLSKHEASSHDAVDLAFADDTDWRGNSSGKPVSWV
jgi:hypothetical protein